MLGFYNNIQSRRLFLSDTVKYTPWIFLCGNSNENVIFICLSMYSCSIKSNLIGLNMYLPPLTIFLGAQEAQRFDSVFAYSGSLFQHKSLSYLLGMEAGGGRGWW